MRVIVVPKRLHKKLEKIEGKQLHIIINDVIDWQKDDSPIIDGCQLYHNYIRPHMGLDGKTPAEVCGIEIKGKDKWKTLIQNASSK